MGENQSNMNASGAQGQQALPNQQKPSPDQQEEEVDVTEDIEKLLGYVKKKADEDQHDTVLSRIKSRLMDIVEKIEGTATPQNNTPNTPEVNLQGAPVWQYIRKRGGKVVKRQVKEQVAKK